MFPNVRLLAGAFVASIMALSCGFGLFAEFRVNHDPLGHLPVGTAPVRFVANEAIAPRAGWGTPFDGQSRLNGPQHSDSVTDVAAAAITGHVKLEAGTGSTAEPITPVALTAPAIDAVPRREIAQPAEIIEPVVSVTLAVPIEKTPVPHAAGQISRSASAAGATSGQTEPSSGTLTAGRADRAASPASVVPDKIASVPPSPASSSDSTASPSDADAAQPTGTIASAAAAAPQAKIDAAQPKQNSEAVEAAPKAAPTPAPPPVIAAATPSDQPAAAVPPAKKGASLGKASEPAKAAEKPVRKIRAKKESKIARKPLARRRVAVRRRGVRLWRRSAGGDGMSNPVFQSAPSFSGPTASTSGYNSSNW